MKPKLLLGTLLLTFGTLMGLQAQEGYGIGDIVSDFSLQNVDETWVALNDYQDEKGVILVVTCNTCPWAQKNEDRIIGLHRAFAPMGFPVVAINPNDPNRSPGDSFAAMKARAESKSYPFPYLWDQSQEVAKSFGATRTPEVILLEKTDAGWAVRYHGAIDDSPGDPVEVEEKFVENAIRQILNDEKVSTEKTKFIGCSIKWKAS